MTSTCRHFCSLRFLVIVAIAEVCDACPVYINCLVNKDVLCVNME